VRLGRPCRQARLRRCRKEPAAGRSIAFPHLRLEPGELETTCAQWYAVRILACLARCWPITSLLMADELKPRFPYSWFGKQWDPEKPIKFSPYVRRRYALSAATETGDKIISSTPPDLLKGEKALEWIYGLLGVLDQKASALMRLNGVMLAAAAFLLHPQYHLLWQRVLSDRRSQSDAVCWWFQSTGLFLTLSAKKAVKMENEIRFFEGVLSSSACRKLQTRMLPGCLGCIPFHNNRVLSCDRCFLWPHL